MTRLVFCGGAAVALLGLALPATVSAQAPPPAPSSAQASLAAAQRKQTYLFVLFWKENNAATQAMRQSLDAALARRSNEATSILVNTTDPAEKAIVAQFGVSRSPMPLVVAVAPNGAVTGGFPLKLTEQEVAGAFVSAGTANCLKGAQARKLILLFVQPAGATSDVPAGIRAFQANPQYGPATDLVTVRADDPTEAALLQSLQISSRTSVPVTALLAPPGRLLKAFAGEVTMQQLVETLKSAQNSCCPGGKCGPGGCCPGGKCGPNQ